MKEDKFYKEEMDSFADVKATVRVIEESAASKIHFLKRQVKALLDYKNQVEKELHRLSFFYSDPYHPLLKKRESGKKVLLVFTGSKGMVSGLYHQIVNEVIRLRSKYQKVLVVGKKGLRYLNEENIKIEEIFSYFSTDKLPSRENTKKAFNELYNIFQDQNLQKIDILYSSFLSLAEQKPTLLPFLPFQSDFNKQSKTSEPNIKLKTENEEGLPIFEPTKKNVFDKLLRKYIDVSLTEIVLEAKLSELAARTVTAESAVQETERLIRTFKRRFLKARHLTVTQKQVESFSLHKMLS